MSTLHFGPLQELSPAELEERERGLRKLREELRNEEMKLVLLKKLRQSQQMKENIAVVPPSQQQGAVTKPPVTGKLPPPPQQQPPPPLVRANHNKQPNVPLLRGVGVSLEIRFHLLQLVSRGSGEENESADVSSTD